MNLTREIGYRFESYPQEYINRGGTRPLQAPRAAGGMLVVSALVSGFSRLLSVVRAVATQPSVGRSASPVQYTPRPCDFRPFHVIRFRSIRTCVPP